MEWQFVVALIIAIPIILFPAAFAWYLNVGGLYQALKEKLARRAAQKEVPQAGLETPTVHNDDSAPQDLGDSRRWRGK